MDSIKRIIMNEDNILMRSAFTRYKLFTLKRGFVFKKTEKDATIIAKKEDATVKRQAPFLAWTTYR